MRRKISTDLSTKSVDNCETCRVDAARQRRRSFHFSRRRNDISRIGWFQLSVGKNKRAHSPKRPMHPQSLTVGEGTTAGETARASL